MSDRYFPNNKHLAANPDLDMLARAIECEIPSEVDYTGPASKEQVLMQCGSCGWEGPRGHTRGLGWCPECRAPTWEKKLPGETDQQYCERVMPKKKATDV
jgi:hypothetical protein